MLAKSGCTMWSGCQGVKSGRFAQDDRPLRHTRHDGDTVPGTQRSEQTLRALGALATICTRTTYPSSVPIAQNADSHSQCERQVARQRPVQSAPRGPLCRCIWNGERHPACSSVMDGTAKPVGSWRGLHQCERVDRHGRTSREPS